MFQESRGFIVLEDSLLDNPPNWSTSILLSSLAVNSMIRLTVSMAGRAALLHPVDACEEIGGVRKQRIHEEAHHDTPLQVPFFKRLNRRVVLRETNYHRAVDQ